MDDDALAMMRELAVGALAACARLDEVAGLRLPTKYARTAAWQVDPDDNPLNAWAVMAEVRAEVASTPAAVIVANHVMGFYELAAIHLSQTPPNFAEAMVGIDAMASVLDKLEGRLGEHEDVLRDARSQLQMAFVELKRQADAGEGA